MKTRVAFVTIGQSPRDDILDEMRAVWGDAIEVRQYGTLDGLTPAEIEGLAPADGEARLVSRLADRREVTLEAAAVERRTAELIQELARGGDCDLIVLLCTGHFEALPTSPLVIESQRVMDHAVAALAPPDSRVGVIIPHAEQAARFSWGVPIPNETIARHASPYVDVENGEAFDEAARDLAQADVALIALHCMGYREADRERVAQATGRPVLLARRLVARAVDELVIRSRDRVRDPARTPFSSGRG